VAKNQTAATPRLLSAAIGRDCQGPVKRQIAKLGPRLRLNDRYLIAKLPLN
jgi:hypothetical protein